jgi:uncharacterized protein (DUF433 family)
MSRLGRITTDPHVCHGKPVIRGLGYQVQTLLELLASGMTFDEFLAQYPDLERDDLLAALEFGALTVGGRGVDRLGTVEVPARCTVPTRLTTLLLEHDAGSGNRGHSYLISVDFEGGVVIASGQATHVIHGISPHGGQRRPVAEAPASTGKTGQVQ